MMLTRIELENFKCFDLLKLECAPLNLLCGLNGMGKSSVIQALLVLRQTYESRDLHQGRLVLGGARADLGTGSDVLFEDAERDVIGFALYHADLQDPWKLAFDYSRESDELSAEDDSATDSSYVPDGWDSTPPFAGNLMYVDAERVGPRKSYPLSDVMSRQGDFGTSSEYAWNYLFNHQTERLPSDDPRCTENESRTLLSLVNEWLQHISPSTNLRLDEVSAADALIAGFSFNRPGDVPTRPYRATNVGFGISYVLPVILALLSGPGTLCLIENPEAHLHPRGQTKLAELAARAACAGVQIFVETHSDHFMDGVRIAVREGVITPDDTMFHYFERKGNKTVVTSPEVDLDGRLSSWPSGFFDQNKENLIKLLGPRI